MIAFMFQLVIAVLILGLLWYLFNWAVATLGLPRPVLVVVTVLMIIIFLYWIWAYFPVAMLPHPVR